MDIKTVNNTCIRCKCIWKRNKTDIYKTCEDCRNIQSKYNERFKCEHNNYKPNCKKCWYNYYLSTNKLPIDMLITHRNLVP